MDLKDILGVLAVIIGAYSYIPYFIGMKRGQVKPHVFTWFIWGLITLIAFAAQLSDKAGPGSWVMGFTGLVCLIIAALALKVGEKNITRSDWVCFWMAMAAIPLWLATHNPLWSVILVSIIDIIGFGPTFRKSWMKPWDEDWQVYILCSVKFALSLWALDNVTWITALYPVVMVVINTAFFGMLMARRRTLTQSGASP